MSADHDGGFAPKPPLRAAAEAAEPVPEALLAVLARVPYLQGLDPETLAEVSARASRHRYLPGERVVAELEPGTDLFVIAEGEAEVAVDCDGGERQVLAKLGPGDAFGEMSALTGELRSATVTARSEVVALVLGQVDFERLRARRPEIARRLVHVLAARLGSAERRVEGLLAGAAPAPPAHDHPPARRGSVRRAWRELVVDRGRDLPFLTLAAFVVVLVAVRVAVFASFHYEVAPRAVLRSAYLTGFALVIGSSCASLLTFRPDVRRAVALAYGAGLALILNELGVTLAFDIFFKDIHTPDPLVPFDIERLYQRTEPHRAVLVGLVVLVQAAYLRRFYRRAAFVLATRARKILSRR